MNNILLTQAGIFAAPIIITLVVWYFNRLAGQKTNINVVLVGLLAGAETLDLSFLPGHVLAPLASGLGASALLANTVLTKRAG